MVSRPGIFFFLLSVWPCGWWKIKSTFLVLKYSYTQSRFASKKMKKKSFTGICTLREIYSILKMSCHSNFIGNCRWNRCLCFWVVFLVQNQLDSREIVQMFVHPSCECHEILFVVLLTGRKEVIWKNTNKNFITTREIVKKIYKIIFFYEWVHEHILAFKPLYDKLNRFFAL